VTAVYPVKIANTNRASTVLPIKVVSGSVSVHHRGDVKVKVKNGMENGRVGRQTESDYDSITPFFERARKFDDNPSTPSPRF